MVPREFRKSLCFAAGFITLLEAVIWGAVSVYLIGVYSCGWDLLNVRGVSVWSMLDITYLMGGCKTDAAIRLGYSSSFPPPSDAASSLQIWLWTNAVLSAIWIPTCFLLMVAVLTEVRSKNGALLYFPWQALTVVLVLYDFAGAVYHAADIFQTMTPDGYAKFTSATSWDNLTLHTPSEGIPTWLPSLMVTLFFCRFLIIWFLNMFLLSVVYKSSQAVSAYKSQNLQTTTQNPEGIKSWRDMFSISSDPIIPHIDTSRFQTEANESQNTEHIQQMRVDTHVIRQGTPLAIQTIDESGIMIEELDKKTHRGNAYIGNNPPGSPYQQRRNIGYIGRSGTPDSFKGHRQDMPPPMAGEITVPPELSRVRPFSYTAGDQPQIVKANISRSNSKAEYPPIPHPDYTIAERRAASLEYIPNRFKVPSPKRPTQHSFNYDQSSPTLGPPKKPQVHPRTTMEVGLGPRSKYIQHSSNMRQTSNSNDYNINKLY